MTESPLAPYLTRFAIEPMPETEAMPSAFEAAALDAFTDEPIELPGEMELEVEIPPEITESEQQLIDLRAELEAEAASRIAALEAEHAEALEHAVSAARESWAQEQGVPLSTQITAGFAALGGEIDAKIAEALSPLLAQAVVDRARLALREGITRLLSDPDHPALTLQAPADLIDAIRREHGEPNGLAYVVRHDVDAVVTGGGMRIESAIGDALAALYAEIG